jgi:biopolymer transport protein TolR
MRPRPATTMLSSELNVTPMLDVLLVLLVIFMASVHVRRAMDVQLPVPCTGACQLDGTPIVLEVLPGYKYRLNGVRLTEADLPARLREVYAGRPDKVLQVAGARDAIYQDVIGAMDVARAAGVRVIGVPSSEIRLSR